MKSRLMNLNEVCEFLFGEPSRSSRLRVHRLINANDIPKIKDGRQYYVSRARIEKIMGSLE
tara:strand:- start:275 stop:457 length:183 start_codon:yes stop_codon:yes gene_type:complete